MTVVPQNLGVPTGTILWSATQEPPVGWLVCDGREFYISDYPVLGLYLGNTFGGDGEFTFGVPDLIGRFVIGSGDPGREPFTYEDGLNGEHIHGMYPNVKHDHGVTDPGHKHVMSGGTHSHTMTSTHFHGCSSIHSHNSPFLVGHSYLLSGTCNREVYAVNYGNTGECPPDPEDIFITEKNPYSAADWYNGKTGIKAVNLAQTGVTVNVALTGVTLAKAATGITLQFSTTGLVIEETGVIGGPRPDNIALTPIIRT